MAIHVLHHRQIVPASVADCWAFFSDPRNLAEITPPELDFRILSELPPAIHAGMMIEYRVRPLFGVPVSWLTEITQVEKERRFVDEQRVGPYRIWHHEHLFTPLAPGRTEIADCVHYVLPGWWVGDLLHALLVRRQLVKIFAFRERAVEGRFGSANAEASVSSR
jgi:ligand-binding SRPBCC domain-containing protein